MTHKTLLVAFALTALTACSGGGFDLEGTWTDGFGGGHTITESTWTENGTGYTNIFHIQTLDNDAMYLTAQNDSSNGYNPDLFSKFNWTMDDDGAYHFCQAAYDAASETAAMDATDADDSDLAAGCGGFGWSSLTEAE